ncbi:MAG: hypothetical protein J0L71_13060 [Candidatus Accumulibacter sp.]|uniref:hypothetical protein n=1 Tax=Accumulibacter sp. TaxID=2053492 RepID=UPI001AC7D9BD|nr:hypothetical protein [Accumulibacter sp.]MBN8518762.1 hypothetical protein [Accumulibacter sp.]
MPQISIVVAEFPQGLAGLLRCPGRFDGKGFTARQNATLNPAGDRIDSGFHLE